MIRGVSAAGAVKDRGRAASGSRSGAAVKPYWAETSLADQPNIPKSNITGIILIFIGTYP
ncbi:hypothetical protein JCM17478_28550 [Thermopirellula anaerolimosa]